MLLIRSFPIIGILLPFVLLLTTALAFYIFDKRSGSRTGYLLGFLFYWTIWCILVPASILTIEEIKGLFIIDWKMFGEQRWTNIVCLIIPLVISYSYAFPKALRNSNAQIIILSFVLALVNATGEETLWRGLYLKFYGNHKIMYLVVSSLGFALWHFSPQIIFPNKAPGGRVSFVLSAFVFGALYATVAFNTHSILLPTLSHILLDFSGLGARVYLTRRPQYKS